MLELQLSTKREYVLDLSDYLLELGALSITLLDAEDNPIFEPELNTLPLWPEIKISALFSADQSLEELLLNLYMHADAEHISSLEQKIIADQDWVRQTQTLTKPKCFAGKLWIYPSWHEVPADNGVKILLDPGLAFGTGAHATTALIMTWLANNPPKNLTVLDYGCGSGILAIAAAKLGAEKVWCTDIDPQALMATQENAKRNNINEPQLITCLPENLPKNLKTDLILANILALPLIQLADNFANYLTANATLVLSGVLEQQTEMLKEAYRPKFTLQSINTQNQWISMVWHKN